MVHTCEFCGLKSKRRYNIDKHKKRKHSAGGGDVNSPVRSTDINHPYQQIQRNYASRNALSNDNYYQRSNMYGSYQGQDWMDQTTIFLRKQVELINLVKQLAPPLTFPSYPYGQHYYYYPTNMQSQYSTGWSNCLNKTVSRAISSGPVHVAQTAEGGLDRSIRSIEESADKYSKNLIALRALACEKCLMIDFIPMISHKGQPFKENNTHQCRRDRLTIIGQQDSRVLKVISDLLHDNLPRSLAHVVRKCLDTERANLCSLKLCSNYPRSREEVGLGAITYPVRFLDITDQVKYRWINRMKKSKSEGGHIQLETDDELFSFLQVSTDSTFIMLAIQAQSGSDYDLYAMGLVLDESCQEKVEPFVPKLSSLQRHQ